MREKSGGKVAETLKAPRRHAIQTNKRTRKTPPCMTATKPHIIPIMYRLLWVLPVTEPATARGRQSSQIVSHWPPGNLRSLLARSIWFGAPGGTAHWVLDPGALHLSCLYPAIIYILILVCLPWLVIPIQGQSCKPFSWRDRSREEISADGDGGWMGGDADRDAGWMTAGTVTGPIGRVNARIGEGSRGWTRGVNKVKTET